MSENLNKRKALVLGASGLVGSELVEILEHDPIYSAIVIVGRTSLNIKNPKVIEQLIDFNRLDDFADVFQGNDLFICLGTTIKKAGSVGQVEIIDRDWPVKIAQIAHKNGITKIAVVSSMGANPSSRNYYLRIKGEMEEGIRKINFDQTVIVRPSMLLGARKEFRLAESIAKGVMKGLGFLMIGPALKYKGIEAQTVARAMIELLHSSDTDIVYLSDRLQKLGRIGFRRFVQL